MYFSHRVKFFIIFIFFIILHFFFFYEVFLAKVILSPIFIDKFQRNLRFKSPICERGSEASNQPTLQATRMNDTVDWLNIFKIDISNSLRKIMNNENFLHVKRFFQIYGKLIPYFHRPNSIRKVVSIYSGQRLERPCFDPSAVM